MAPPTGVRMSGVRKAVPGIPYFCQIKTNLRVLLVNRRFFFFLNLAMSDLICGPKNVNKVTVNIIPAAVKMAVSVTLTPAATPIVGPAMNFTVLLMKIEK